MKKKRILLQYHIWERESIILEILKNEIEKYNVEVGYGDYMDVKRCLDFCPDIIITHPIRTSSDAQILSLMKLVTGAVLIPMTVEGYYDFDLPNIVAKMVGIDACSKKLIDYYIMWGKKAKRKEGEQLLKLHKISSIDKIIDFGYVLYEKEKVIDYYKKQENCNVFFEWKRDYPRIVTCITGFHGADVTMENIYLEKPFANKEGTEKYEEEVACWKQYLEFLKNYREKYVNDIMKLAQNCPDIGIVVKLHPGEVRQISSGKANFYDKLKKFKNIFVLESTFPMAIILKNTELLVHYASTVALEAYIYDVPTLLRSAKPINESFPSIGDKKVGIYTCEVEISDYEAFEMCIKEGIQFCRDERAEQVLSEGFNWRKGEKYCPSEDIAFFLSTDLVTEKVERQELEKQGYVSKEALSGVRTQIYKRILKSVINFNFTQMTYYIKCLFRTKSSLSELKTDFLAFIKRRKK